jgi:hypothetical protein
VNDCLQGGSNVPGVGLHNFNLDAGGMDALKQMTALRLLHLEASTCSPLLSLQLPRLRWLWIAGAACRPALQQVHLQVRTRHAGQHAFTCTTANIGI